MAQSLESKKSRTVLYCSFCGKSQKEVRKLIAGPTVFICDECTDLCVQIVLENVDREAIPELFPNTLKDESGRSLLSTILAKLDAQPIYDIKGLSVDPKSAFYLGPFSSPFNEIYSDFVRPIAEEKGFFVRRADEIFGSRPIMHDIWEGIFTSAFIIADVTRKNPNVMYEIGLAHTMGKSVIMLTQDINDVPFDLRHYRCVIYDYTPRGCEALVHKLQSTIDALKNVPYRLALRGKR